jgi:hypothetical protein
LDQGIDAPGVVGAEPHRFGQLVVLPNPAEGVVLHVLQLLQTL